jgi:hypothetical protein
MPIDSSIALGVKPVQIESPLNQMANVYALQNAQQSNQLNQLNLGEAQRKIEDRNRLRSTLGGFASDMSVDQQVNALARGGFLDEAKALAESSAKVSKDKREAEKAASDLKANSIKFHRDLLPTVRDQASYEQWGMNAIKDIPELGKMLPAQYDPALIPQLAMSADKYIEANKPQILQQNLGGKANIVSVNPYTGKQEIVSSSAMSLAPGEQQRLANENKRIDLERQRIANDQNPNIVASTLTDEAGNVTQYNKFGTLIGTKPNVGKPSAQFTKTKAAKQQLSQDLDLAIKELENATKKGGLIETATGSGAGALRDIGAGFFGTTTEGAEALGALRPIYDKVLKMVPRFEGPQSDKDTASYNLAAGDLGNAAAPTGKKLAAAKTILRLMKDRKAQFLTRDMAEGGTPSGDGVDSSNPLLK